VLIATAIALASIGLGALLGLMPGSAPRTANPFQTFAIVTSVAVVLGQLLPESLGAVGVGALGACGLGFAIPRMAERLAVRLRAPACVHDDAMCTDLGLEIGYIGLVLHHIGDGIGLGLYTGPLHAGHTHYDVLVAIATHTVPVIALVVLAFKTHRGASSAGWRALGIAASTLLGVGLANLLRPEQLAAWEPWLTALVSGLLLHIVAHGWPVELRATSRSRLMDFAAIGVGLAIVAFAGHSHAEERGLPDVRHSMGDALLELGLDTAPMLLLGLMAAAVLQTQGARIPLRWLQSGGRLSQALRGALLGIPLPVCACGVLPVAHSLRLRGAAAAMVVAFLLGTPELGVETFALTVQFLGWPFAYMRLIGALLLAVIVGLVVARFADRTDVAPRPAAEQVAFDARSGGWIAQVAGNFDELLYHIGAWTLVGLLAAAYLQAALTDGSLRFIADNGLDVLVVSLLAIPSYVCASSATPLAAVLLAKGISPGAVLTGLLLGPSTNIATLAWLRSAFGMRAMLWAVAALLGTSWSLAFVANRLLVDAAAVATAEVVEHDHGLLQYASLVLLIVLIVRAVWRTGLRSWLGSLGEGLSFQAEPHSHAHGAHAHGSVEHSHGTH